MNIHVSKVLFILGPPTNSFQINTPQNAATIVAPCPNPYEMAAPAFSVANKLNRLPMPQIIPPNIPTACKRNYLQNNPHKMQVYRQKDASLRLY